MMMMMEMDLLPKQITEKYVFYPGEPCDATWF
jgi:hypothetical protein